MLTLVVINTLLPKGPLFIVVLVHFIPLTFTCQHQPLLC